MKHWSTVHCTPFNTNSQEKSVEYEKQTDSTGARRNGINPKPDCSFIIIIIIISTVICAALSLIHSLTLCMKSVWLSIFSTLVCSATASLLTHTRTHTHPLTLPVCGCLNYETLCMRRPVLWILRILRPEVSTRGLDCLAHWAIGYHTYYRPRGTVSGNKTGSLWL